MKKTIVAKTISVYIFAVITILFFYTYSGILGHSVLIIDIISVFLWISLAHFISYKLLLTMCLTFSVNPPKIDLFRDSVTGLYGIIPKNALPSWIFCYGI